MKADWKFDAIVLAIAVLATVWLLRFSFRAPQVYESYDHELGVIQIECRQSLIPGEWEKCKLTVGLADAEEGK